MAASDEHRFPCNGSGSLVLFAGRLCLCFWCRLCLFACCGATTSCSSLSVLVWGEGGGLGSLLRVVGFRFRVWLVFTSLTPNFHE